MANYVSVYKEELFVLESATAILHRLEMLLADNPHGRVLVGLSGGDTPRDVYAALGRLGDAVGCLSGGRPSGGDNVSPSCELRRKLDSYIDLKWERLIFFMVDERYWGEGEEGCSNAFMVERTLMANSRIGKENFLYPDIRLPVEECRADYARRLGSAIQRWGGPHLAILGMGKDGHIASWFPPLSQEAFAHAMRPDTLVAIVEQDVAVIKTRITCSLALVCGSKYKIYLLKGQEKKERWQDCVGLLGAGPKSQASLKGGPLSSEAARHPLLNSISSNHTDVISFPPIHEDYVVEIHKLYRLQSILVYVFGASGDLATKKTFPALFSLFCEGYLPSVFRVVGYARTSMGFDEFWDRIKAPLIELEKFYIQKHRTVGDLAYETAESPLAAFRENMRYVSGQYDSMNDFIGLFSKQEDFIKMAPRTNELVYLALPPHQFAPVMRTFKKADEAFHTESPSSIARVPSPNRGWRRVVLEKPFGHDLTSAEALSREILELLDEDQIYRIDHYLGKEMALSILAIRFANIAFKALFHRDYVACVRVTCKEEIGTMGRGGYFDGYGIVRDIMQNHLLQLLTLVAMERPASLQDDDIRDEKVKVLKQMPPIKLSESLFGQYVASPDGKQKGYKDDPTVPEGSRCPTFATMVCWVNNDRWAGVPFILKAGKALEAKSTEIRLQLREVPGSLYEEKAPNELVFRVQPRESVYLKLLTKKPALSSALQETELDLTVRDRFGIDRLPEAYERLILDIFRGDKSNFVRTDELRAAWKIFTPILNEMETGTEWKLYDYPFGSAGPPAAYEFIRKHYSYNANSTYAWPYGDSRKTTPGP